MKKIYRVCAMEVLSMDIYYRYESYDKPAAHEYVLRCYRRCKNMNRDENVMNDNLTLKEAIKWFNFYNTEREFGGAIIQVYNEDTKIWEDENGK